MFSIPHFPSHLGIVFLTDRVDKLSEINIAHVNYTTAILNERKMKIKRDSPRKQVHQTQLKSY